MSGTIPNTWWVLWQFILIAVWSIKNYFYPHFTDEKPKFQEASYMHKVSQLVDETSLM